MQSFVFVASSSCTSLSTVTPFLVEEWVTVAARLAEGFDWNPTEYHFVRSTLRELSPSTTISDTSTLMFHCSDVQKWREALLQMPADSSLIILMGGYSFSVHVCGHVSAENCSLYIYDTHGVGIACSPNAGLARFLDMTTLAQRL